MGMMCSWIAVRTGDKAALLEHLGLIETGELVTPGCDQSAMSIHQSADGWTILFSEDFGWATSDQILALSRFGLALGVQFEDEVAMEASAHAADKGVTLWRVSHTAEEDRPLEVTGTPPKELGAIRRKFERKQAEDDGADWLFEIPLELARKISGYRVDEDAAEFVALDFATVSPARQPHRRRDGSSRQARYEKPMWPRNFGCSIIAVRTDAKDKLFDHLRLIETEKLVWPRNGKSMMSFYETGRGWLILLSEDIYWATDKRLRDLSRFGLAVCTAMSDRLDDMSQLQGAIDGQIIWTVPCSPEELGMQELSADIRAALDRPWSKFQADLREGRDNVAMQQAVRQLLGFDLVNPNAPFTALKRRWPWMRRRRRS